MKKASRHQGIKEEEGATYKAVPISSGVVA
jgi:hypothetical protein